MDNRVAMEVSTPKNIAYWMDARKKKTSQAAIESVRVQADSGHVIINWWGWRYSWFCEVVLESTE